MKKYREGLVSVVIPTYKRSDMLCRAIESVLGQTYQDVECIVVNDNTPGDEYSQVLYERLKKYENDSRFHFIEQEVHKNGAAARNTGIRVAKGEYIAFLDDDDFWDKEKVEVQVGVLKDLPDDWGAVSCMMKFYRKGKIYAATYPYRDGDIHFAVLARTLGLGTGSLIIRRKALDETGYFDESLYRFQDPQLFSCLTEKYKVKLVKKYLHNRDVDDAQNRPTIENINAYEEAFLKSVAPQLNKLSQRDVNIIRTKYNFDKAPVYWRCGDKLGAIKYFLGIFKYPETILMALRKIRGRRRRCVNIEKRLKKYS